MLIHYEQRFIKGLHDAKHLVGKIFLEGGCDTSQIMLCEYLLTLLFRGPALSRGV